MSGYRIEWDCCGDETYTQAWIPEECPFCESHRLQRELTAAKSEIERLRGRVENISSAAWAYMNAANDPSRRVFYRIPLEDAIAEAAEKGGDDEPT